MLLSDVYQQWEEKTKRQGLEQGQRLLVENLLEARFGELDEQLTQIIPSLLKLPTEECTALLLRLSTISREELVARFQF